MRPLLPGFVTVAFATALSGRPTHVVAQCPFDPTVAPDNLILCPNTQDTLHTQVYDSYQWYKAGAPLVGETGPTLLVDAYNDAAYYFSVEATLNGCTEMSAEVLVDGWVFLPPTVMTAGPEPLYFSQNGPVYCGLDTVLLVMMQPYDSNIQWTNAGDPIPGATDDTLMVTTPGQYSASGAPSLCPDYQQQLGVWVDVLFTAPVQPVIVMGDVSLCASPEGVAYQWYLDGEPIPGDAPCIVGTSPGVYTVDVTYEVDCSIPSDGFVVTSVSDEPHLAALRVGPVPANDQLTISSGDGAPIGPWRLFDATGRVVVQGDGSKSSAVRVDVGAVHSGAYWLRCANGATLPVSIAR